MRNVSTSLFDLVQKLDKAEKRYFKLNASTYGQKSNYIKLFEAVDKQRTYKEEQIRKQFKNEAFSNNLHVTKRILFNQILKTLLPNFSEKKYTFKIRELIGYAEILLLKGLYKECNEQLTKAKKMANAYESHEQMLEILRVEQDLLFTQSDLKKIGVRLNSFSNELSTLQEIINNKQQYFNWLLNISLIKTQRGNPGSSDELITLDEVLKQPLMQDENMALSYEAKVMFYNIKMIGASANRDSQKLFLWNKKLITHLESKPKLLEYKFNAYIISLHNIAIAQLQLKQYVAFKKSIEKLKLSRPNALYTDVESNKFVSNFLSRTLELQYYTKTGQFEEGIQLNEEFEGLLKEYEQKLNIANKLSLYYDIAYCYFCAGKYKSALNWIHKTLNNQEKNLKLDVVSYARILYLIILYDRSDYDFLEYQISSASRFLRTRSKLYEVEKVFIKRMNKILMMNDVSSTEEQFKKFENDLIELENHLSLKNNSYFNFSAWVNSKIGNSTYGELIKKEAVLQIQ